MKKDQLVMYAKNHRASLINLLAVVVFFIMARYKLYGPPHGWQGYLTDSGVMAWSLLFLLRQRWLYGRILAQGNKIEVKSVTGMIIELCVNRLLYMLPWLCLLFFPYHSEYLYTHLLGYLFIFAVTATYASASAPLLGMMVFDIGVPVLFAAVITVMNWHVQETPYIGGALFFFSVYVFFIGLKIRASTLQLIDSKYQMQKSAQRADEANRAKSSFLALMSHEIRTPMTGIFGMIDFLKETDLTTEQKQFVVTIRECSKTLLNTLNDILDFSKVESGKLTISKINFDYHALLHNSSIIMRQLANDKGLLLDISIQKNVPQMIYGDPHRLQQTILNLLNNAVKFTDTGSVSLRAGLTTGGKATETPSALLRIEVKDTGIGMTREGMDNLFSAFSQADSSISRRYGGTGLGLSITKSLIELMGGRLGCTSEPDKGSTFWFEVPYERPVAMPAPEAKERPLDITKVPPLHILVVEDNLINQQIVTRLLTHKKHDVTAVTNANDAIAAVRITDFDMILMDVNMPGKSGIDAARSIRAMGDKYRKIPIIALTANIMEDYVKNCYEAGMVDHIAKPFSPEEIYAGIARNLRLPKAEGKAASQKRPAQSAKTMKQVLDSIRDELGAEYLLQMVAGNIREANRLMGEVKAAQKMGDTDKLVAAVHDMKSICGLIGMQKTSQSASIIETEGIKGSKDRLAGAILTLEALMKTEAAQALEMMAE